MLPDRLRARLQAASRLALHSLAPLRWIRLRSASISAQCQDRIRKRASIPLTNFSFCRIMQSKVEHENHNTGIG